MLRACVFQIDSYQFLHDISQHSSRPQWTPILPAAPDRPAPANMPLPGFSV